MEIPIKDKSNYLRGLLIVAKKDNQLTEPEKNIIRHLAEKLGFATDFYEETLRNLLANKYIKEDPLRFSNPTIAETFIKDALKLVYSDNAAVNKEIDWLKETAEVNNIEADWFEKKNSFFKNSSQQSSGTDFALFSII
jgi:hypothetical protein